jgi:hypothetical protein
MSKLQKKPAAHRSGHPTLQNMNFFYFCGSFLPSWIRIRIRIPNTDPDPLARLNTDPIRIRNPGFGYTEDLAVNYRPLTSNCFGAHWLASILSLRILIFLSCDVCTVPRYIFLYNFVLLQFSHVVNPLLNINRTNP